MPQPIAPDNRNLLLGKGAIYFDRFDSAGNRTGEVHLGNCTSLTISTEDEKIQKFSSMDQSAGLYREATRQRLVSLNIQGDEFTPFNAALLYMGEEGTLSQEGGSIEGEVLTSSPKLGRWYPLANRNVSGVTVEQDGYTLVVDEDYTIDAVRGRIYLLPDGDAEEGTPITVDYTAGAVSLEQVIGATQGLIEGFLRFVGDPSAGPITELEVWKCSITPGGETGWISDDWGNWQLTMAIQKDEANHPTMPYYRQVFNGAR